MRVTMHQRVSALGRASREGGAGLRGRDERACYESRRRVRDDTAERLERELRSQRSARRQTRPLDSKRSRRRKIEARWERRSRRREARWQAAAGTPGYRTARLFQDKRRQKIAGVCAGIARYFGVEVWVVRGMAITALIFMPSVVIPAYIIASFVLPKAPNGETANDDVVVAKNRDDHSSPVPELGAQLSPRRSVA
jgi:phage shock protein PspC (stress-responsive transcriptional regulator)